MHSKTEILKLIKYLGTFKFAKILIESQLTQVLNKILKKTKKLNIYQHLQENWNMNKTHDWNITKQTSYI